MTGTDHLRAALIDLGAQIADHGSRTQEQALRHIAAWARPFSPGAAEALLDDRSPEVVRWRAFDVAASRLLSDLDDSAAGHLSAQLAHPTAPALDRVDAAYGQALVSVA